MSIFKRLSLTWMSRLDDFVSEIENHEALIEAALKEHAKKVAEAKVQKRQFDYQIQQYQEKVLSLGEQKADWTRRAVELAENDKKSALECVKRSNAITAKIETLNQNLTQYRQAASRLSSHIERGESELAQIKQKLDLLKARQVSSNAVKNNSFCDQDNLEEVQKAFMNWEKKVSVSELINGCDNEVDSFAQSFEQVESEQALTKELDALVVAAKQNDSYKKGG
ncbi:MAG: PspA/IM30 family protein [Kangiellaceae bacterium]|nr:PspA/IM30 family protein [Kangiellaceae bacterium]MCW8998901.1 PspA/IM30 family protein [Kangiellaceae bacterium]